MLREKSSRFDEMEQHYKSFISSMIGEQEKAQKANDELEKELQVADEKIEDLLCKNEELTDLIK